MRRPGFLIQQNVELAQYTTLGIGGPARDFCRVTSQAQLLEAIAFGRQRNLKVFVLGGGSNLLVPDSGFDGLVLQIAIEEGLRVSRSEGAIEYVVPAGIDWDGFVLDVCREGVSGVECLAGIPGLTGGTPVQNVGAYGQEVAETIHSVRAFDRRSSEFVELPRAECAFGYRTSIFNTTERGRYIVTAVTFQFSPETRPKLSYAELRARFGEEQPTPMDVYHAVRQIRKGKGMLLVQGDPDARSAGSFFKNPIVPPETLAEVAAAAGVEPDGVPHWPAANGAIKLPAAWLVERAGFPKGFTMGAAGISSRHALALINRGGARFEDVVRLRDRIRDEVEGRFGVRLEQEPVILG